MKRGFLLAAGLVASAFFAAMSPSYAQSPGSSTQLPPAATGSSTLSPFVGIWSGAWSHGPSHTLTVQSVNSDNSVNLVYQLGPGWGSNSPVELRPSAQVVDNVLTVYHKDGSTVQYAVIGHTLSALYRDKNHANPHSATLVK